MGKAQASMEYLLLLAAVLFFFSMLVPLLQKTHALSFFAADVSNARQFADELGTKARELSFLGDGSMLALKAKPVESWLIKSEEDDLLIIVENNSLQKEIVFAVEFPNKIYFPEMRINGKTTFVLRKENGTVLFENP